MPGMVGHGQYRSVEIIGFVLDPNAGLMA